MRIVSPLALLIVGSAVYSQAQAQTAPDAGSLRQQIERQLPAPSLPASSDPLKTPEPTPLVLPTDVRLTVKRFAITGNTLIAEDRLLPRVQSWLGRPVGFAELQEAMRAVAQAYREAGWIVRTLLPQQDVTEGVVTIQVIESRFAGSRVESPQAKRVRPERLNRFIEAQQKKGEPLNARALDRALLLADDLPGVTLTGALEPGQNHGETGLVLQAQDEPIFDAELGIDNWGSRSTGARRLFASGTYNGIRGVGDRARIDLVDTTGSVFFRMGYTTPIGYDGWQLGVNGSWFDYKLTSGDFAGLNGMGDSGSLGVDLSYPLIRSRLHNLYFTTGLDQRRYRNDANDVRQSEYSVTAANIGLVGNLYDRWGGINNMNVAFVGGRVRQGALQPAENPALNGGYGKLRYALSRLQMIDSRLSLYTAVSGQYANDRLDSSERFYLGGPTGVRAYPVNEGSGSRGVLATVELRLRLPAGFTMAPFYDYGSVSNPDTGPNYSLKGGGLAVGWTGPYRVGLKGSVAVRHGRNPNRTANGRDQDGSYDKVRFWLQASVPVSM